MNPLVIIPARSGSKGVKNKNIKLLAGKPLIYYTIEGARKVFNDTNIFVSTDSAEIKNIVEQTGLKVPILRPSKLATDEASAEDVILHAVEYYRRNNFLPDLVVYLQPTSPFRTETNIRESLKLFNKEIDMVVSVKQAKANPYFNLFEENSDGFLVKSKQSDYTRRQDCPNVWELNGAIYNINVNSLLKKPFGKFDKIVKYIMPEKESVDIDSQFDWQVAEYLLA